VRRSGEGSGWDLGLGTLGVRFGGDGCCCDFVGLVWVFNLDVGGVFDLGVVGVGVVGIVTVNVGA